MILSSNKFIGFTLHSLGLHPIFISCLPHSLCTFFFFFFFLPSRLFSSTPECSHLELRLWLRSVLKIDDGRGKRCSRCHAFLKKKKKKMKLQEGGKKRKEEEKEGREDKKEGGRKQRQKGGVWMEGKVEGESINPTICWLQLLKEEASRNSYHMWLPEPWGCCHLVPEWICYLSKRHSIKFWFSELVLGWKRSIKSCCCFVVKKKKKVIP